MQSAAIDSRHRFLYSLLISASLGSFYDSLFWYGAVYRDEGELPAMNFKDLMEQFSTGSIWSRSAWVSHNPHDAMLGSEVDKSTKGVFGVVWVGMVVFNGRYHCYCLRMEV